jgi:hypothetical protein
VARLVTPKRPAGELRCQLLAEQTRFRDLYGRVGPEAWAELSKAVEQLSRGDEYRLTRYELPFDHPERGEGAIHDRLVLGTDDVLRQESSP